jgi:beta-lactamase superfamily II metal-dependent hydrolase
MQFRLLIIFLLALLGAAPTRSAPLPPEISIAFIDVGQGDATLIRDGSGYDILVDGGRKSAGEELIDYILAVGVDDLEVILATHADSDHIGGLIKVLESEDIPVESVYYNGYPGATLTWQEFEAAVTADGLLLLPLQYPETLSWGELDINVLNPPDNLVNPEQNEASVVLLIDYAQVTLLLPGDIGSAVEAQLPGRAPTLQADILKIAHHGSKFSSSQAFLESVQPGEAIISVGVNSYGHPAPETMARLIAVGTNIWRTDQVGTITVTSDGSSYELLPKITFLPLLLQIFKP